MERLSFSPSPGDRGYTFTLMRIGFLTTSLFLVAVNAAAAAAAPSADSDVGAAFAKAPLRFEAVSADWWVARGPGFGVGVTGDGALLGIGKERLRLRFQGSAAHVRLTGEMKSKTPNNYFRRERFRSADVFLRLRRSGLYPGIDAVYYGQGPALEYDFELAPGADPSPIRIRFEGAASVRLAADGSLILTVGGAEVTQKPPVTYQRLASGEVVSVPSSYYPEDDGSYSIRLGAYNASEALVIDPQLLFTAYLAGSGAEEPLSLSRDQNGSIYVVGKTFSNDFPLTGQAYSGFNLTPNEHIFTTKLNPLATGDDVIPYSGFFGGDFGDIIRAAVVDPNGVLFMTGITDDFFFPVTPNAYRDNNGNVRRVFLSALDTRLPGKSGLIYSTFFGGGGTDQTGSEEPTAIALHNGMAYITGFTSFDNYPVKNPVQEKRTPTCGGEPPKTFDAWIAQFDITKSGAASLVNSTHLGGCSNDIPRSIAVDALGEVYVAGWTSSTNFPVTANAIQAVYSGQRDAFLAKLDLNAARIDYATYFGTPLIDEAWKVLVEPTGRVALGGFTMSSDFPVTANAMQPVAGGSGDAFLTIFDLNTTDPSRTVVYSTYYGGSGGEVINDMRVGPSGAYYFCGYTLSRDLPVRDAYKSVSAGQSTDGFIAIVDPSAAPADALLFSTYITGGGAQIVRAIEVDPAGVVYATGFTLGNVFLPGQATPFLGESNVFFLAFKPSPPAVVRREAAETPPSTEPGRLGSRAR